MNWSAAVVALVPSGVVTVTSTVPVPAGATAVMMLSLFTVKVAGLVPKLTAVAPVNAAPLRVTGEPFGPEAGLTPVTVGAVVELGVVHVEELQGPPVGADAGGEDHLDVLVGLGGEADRYRVRSGAAAGHGGPVGPIRGHVHVYASRVVARVVRGVQGDLVKGLGRTHVDRVVQPWDLGFARGKAARAVAVEDIADRDLGAVVRARGRAAGERRFVELGLTRSRGRAVRGRAAGVGELVGRPVALVPAGVVTVTSTVPAAGRGGGRDGGRAHDGDAVAALGPKSTAVAPVKLVPVTVTLVRRRPAPRWG